MTTENTSQSQTLIPVSLVLFRALLEPCHTDEAEEKVLEFLHEAQDVWKQKKSAQDCDHISAPLLAQSYQKWEEQGLISENGQIKNPISFYCNNNLDGFLCRPKGFAPVNYQKSKAFAALYYQASQSLSR